MDYKRKTNGQFDKGNRTNLGKKFPPSKKRNGKVVACEICGSPYYVAKNRLFKTRFCSNRCMGVNRSRTKQSRETIERRRATRRGYRHSEETKRKIGLANRFEDRSRLKKRDERNDVAYKEWRHQVWLRDNFKCKIANPDCKGRIEAHHILGWTNYPELRYQINNGITLCHAHHPRKRAEEKRLSPYFQVLVSVSKE